MHNMVFHFSVSYFRSRLLAVILLAAFFVSFMPVAGIAQSPTATIQSLSGAVLASGQPVTVGAVLNAGDTIETQAGAAAVLALSDGSILRLGENTQINLSDLTQTATGARGSWLKLLRGRIRALLSPDPQKAGSG